MNITYPEPIGEKYCIGVTAPSAGLGSKVFIERFELVKKQIENSGTAVIEGECLRLSQNHVSSNINNRVRDFIKFWENPQIDLIQPPWGGEILIELLEKIDFTKLKKSPTWAQGYSDISTLLFAITVKSGIATAHGSNFMDSIHGQDQLTAESRNYLKIAPGGSLTQKSSAFWQKSFVDFADQLDSPFNLTEKTFWTILNGTSSCEISGRIVGGCLDTITHLVGTPYGDVPKFVDDYAPNGIILYLENCEQSPTELYRSLVGMKYARWFDNINGVIFGRNSGPDRNDFSYRDALEKFFDSFSIPVVIDADIGHKPPQMTIINGCVAKVQISNGSAELTQEFI